MKVLIFTLSLIASAHAAGPQPPKALYDLQETFNSIASSVMPSCVNISAYHEEEVAAPPEFYFMDPQEFFYHFFEGPGRQAPGRSYKRRYSGTGSGVIIDPEGYVLTNAHVIQDAQEIRVRSNFKGSKKNYPAKVVGRDERLDLALLKIQGRGPFPAAQLGDSGQSRVGDWAIAVGSPFELEQTFTVGVISALRQSLPIKERTYQNLIQTDAAINPGNSGGPLLNIRGEIVGINTAIFSPSGAFAGVGFAIPVNAAKEILPDLRLGRERQWGWLGVSAAEVDDVVKKQFGLPKAEGALVNQVFQGSPAGAAGLKRGDVILKFRGQTIHDPHELTEEVRRSPAGQKIKIQYIRQGKIREADVTLGTRPRWADIKDAPEDMESEESAPAEPEQSGWQWQGVDLSDIQHPKAKALLRRLKAMDAQRGAVVISLENTSPLTGYLEPGDVIQGINQRDVESLTDFKRHAQKIDLKEGVVLDIIRQGNKLFISVQAP